MYNDAAVSLLISIVQTVLSIFRFSCSDQNECLAFVDIETSY